MLDPTVMPQIIRAAQSDSDLIAFKSDNFLVLFFGQSKKENAWSLNFNCIIPANLEHYDRWLLVQ